MSEAPNNQVPPSGRGVVEVDLLDGGSLSTAMLSFVIAGAENTTARLYDWCFHIHHLSSGRHILWDVGISSVWKDFSTTYQTIY